MEKIIYFTTTIFLFTFLIFGALSLSAQLTPQGTPGTPHIPTCIGGDVLSYTSSGFECVNVASQDVLRDVDFSNCQYGIQLIRWDALARAGQGGLVHQCRSAEIVNTQITTALGIPTCAEGQALTYILEEVSDEEGREGTPQGTWACEDLIGGESAFASVPQCTGNGRVLQFDGSQFLCSCGEGSRIFAFFNYVCLESGESISDHLTLSKIASAVATFETDVAISQDGNTLFVSAPETITTGVFYTGAVYEFTKSGNSWSQQSRIAHGTGGLSLSNDDYFGASVAISQDGNTLFVGAQNDDTGGFDRGAVYVFSRSGNSWTEQSKIAHGNSGLSLSNSGNFGSSVAISPDGNTLFVGANRYISNAGGAVYVLSKSGNSWTQQSVIAHGTGGLSLAYYDSVDGSGTSVYYETFGSSIAISPDGNTLFVGASVENLVPFSLGDAPGAVYVFEKSGSSWTLQSKITDGNSGLSLSGFAKFGSDVAVSQDGNTLFVGAKTDITVGSGDGAVYVLSKSGNSWTQQSRIAHGTDGLSLEGRSGSSFVFNFGSAVAISPDGNTLFVGAEGDPTDLSNFGFGEVHILELE